MQLAGFGRPRIPAALQPLGSRASPGRPRGPGSVDTDVLGRRARVGDESERG